MIRLIWSAMVLGAGIWIGTNIQHNRAVSNCVEHGGTWIDMLGICQ